MSLVCILLLQITSKSSSLLVHWCCYCYGCYYCCCYCWYHFFLHRIESNVFAIPLAIVNVNDFHFCSSQLCWWSLTFCMHIANVIRPQRQQKKKRLLRLLQAIRWKSLMYLWFNTHLAMHFVVTVRWRHFIALQNSKITHCITILLARRLYALDGYKLKKRKKPNLM